LSYVSRDSVDALEDDCVQSRTVEIVACNLCGSTRHTSVYRMPDRRFFPLDFFTVVECDECGLGFVNPRPSAAEIQKYYPPEYFEQPATKSHERYLHRRFSAEASYLREMKDPNSPGRLLDVGCANGDFPRFMAARGWIVEGVEISESSQRIKDFRVHTQEFQNIAVNEPAYDAVTAWAVLEHVHDPMAYFRKAAQVLKKNGLFVFLVTNFESVTSRYLFCEDVPRHLYFFTRKTIRQYLNATGFALEREDNGRSIYKLAPVNWLSYMLRTRLKRQKFLFEDLPLTHREFRARHNLPRGLRASLKYAFYSPASVIDRTLWPAIETAQILRKNYGISTYVGRKL
jgi:cyclopropane fatty-acyl-phospholipid synthase-like methyltransferase/ribosomal protein S27E